MKTTCKFLLFLVFFSFAIHAKAQDNKPAAQGYIKGQPSNVNQDRALKELEKQENETHAPKETPKSQPTQSVERKEPAVRSKD